ncbi:NlpC/P60 family protein [Litorimonas sp. WD9-15]|uniref:NlpC/P60 family protein n=1 Tax=Litorimonas sp. WD9-15 TaxID=3418716 RepID=UPI003D0132F4
MTRLSLDALRDFCPPRGWQADLIGLPYDFHGFDRTGLSCWGLACLVWMEQAGVVLPTFADRLPADPTFSTDRVRAVNALIAEQVSIFRPLDVPRPLCLVQMRNGRNLTHVGLYAWGGRVVHADEEANGGAGAVVQGDWEDLKACITGFFWPSDALFRASISESRS